MWNFNLSQCIGIDLGTNTIRLYVRGRGIVLCEPSVVAINENINKVCAIGKFAEAMIGRTSEEVRVIHPISSNTIINFRFAKEMLNKFIQKALKTRTIINPQFVVGISSNASKVERQSIVKLIRQVGARKIYFIEKGIAAMLGLSISFTDPSSSMIIDIGENTAEISIMSFGEVIKNSRVSINGAAINTEIIHYIKNKYGILISERIANEIKLKNGCLGDQLDNGKIIQIGGQDLSSGLPKILEIQSNEITEILSEQIFKIVEAVKTVLENVEVEFVEDIVNRGIILIGGGALIEGMDKFISDELTIPVFTVENAQECVISGIGRVVEDAELFNKFATEIKS